MLPSKIGKSALGFVPPGIDARQWMKMSTVGRVFTEAGVYLAGTELPKGHLYIERLIGAVDLDGNRTGIDLPQSFVGITRHELKQFIQYLDHFLSRSTYVRRVHRAAENRGMNLLVYEDDASLSMRVARV